MLKQLLAMDINFGNDTFYSGTTIYSGQMLPLIEYIEVVGMVLKPPS